MVVDWWSRNGVIKMEKSNIWGPLATAIFTFIIIAASAFSQFTAVFLYSGSESSGLDIDSFENTEAAEAMMNNGSLTYLSVGLSAIVCIALTLIVIKLKRGSNLREYLALNAVAPKTLWKWIGIGAVVLVAVQIVFSIIPQMLGVEVNVGDVAAEMESSEIPLLFVLAIVVLAPLFEEVLFRGFLFKGLISTRLGAVGTIVITAFTFAVIHAQYDLIVLANVFSIGILLGYARYKTNSLLTPLILHMLLNGISLIPAFL